MKSKKAVVAASLVCFGLALEDTLFTVVRVPKSDMKPLINNMEYVLVDKLELFNSPFLVFRRSTVSDYEVGYIIADENEWIKEKQSPFRIQIAKNVVAYDTLNNHEHTVINKSLLVGRAILNLSQFEWLWRKYDDLLHAFTLERIHK